MVFALLRRRLKAFVFPAIFLAAAMPAIPVRADARCGGSDMLAEMAIKSPAVFARIEAAAVATPNAEAVLWRIERAASKPSHLFGTVHLSDPRVTTFSPALTAAIGSSKRIALEIADMSPAALGAAMGKAGPLLVYTDGSRLDARLAPDDYARVRTRLAQAGLPEPMVAVVRPWFAYMLLSLPDCERRRSASGVRVLDMKLAEAGRERGLEVIGLETLESQLTAMATVSDAQQVDMLRATLKHLDRADDLMESMLQMYLTRRMGRAWPLTLALAAEANVAASAFSGFESELVIKRNLTMRDKLLALLAEGELLVGVGALHLVGANGLVALLRDAGYTVTAIE